MSRSKFVPSPKPLPKIQTLGTLARKRVDLQRQIEGLKAQLDSIESNIRFLTEDQEYHIAKSKGTWYEVHQNYYTRTTYNADKLREHVSAKVLNRCKQTSDITTLYVKPVGTDYVKTNYDF